MPRTFFSIKNEVIENKYSMDIRESMYAAQYCRSSPGYVTLRQIKKDKLDLYL